MPYKRFATKAFVWEIISHIIGWILVFLFTGEIVLATGVTLVSLPVKMFVYFWHEKFWSWVKWDK